MTAKTARAGPLPAFHFSTDHFAEGERSAAWREQLGSRLDVEITPHAGPIHCDMKLYALPRLRVLFGRGSAASFARKKAASEGEEYMFGICAGGPWRAAQR